MTDAATLLRAVARNKFLPAPPPDLMSCGDGDYRAIGAEFLGHFIRPGGLLPHHAVLDIGCGVGRMAIPLTQYLDDGTRYEGVDVAPHACAWCADTITPAYPSFRFTHLNVAHPLYHPEGTGMDRATTLPFTDGAFDFICMVSVLTHLDAAATLAYAAECARLLAPGGTVFATAFLLNPPAWEGVRAGRAAIAFPDQGDAGVHYADPDSPFAAVAFHEDRLLELFQRHGLHRKGFGHYGHWSGRDGLSFQDICIFQRTADA